MQAKVGRNEGVMCIYVLCVYVYMYMSYVYICIIHTHTHTRICLGEQCSRQREQHQVSKGSKEAGGAREGEKQ